MIAPAPEKCREILEMAAKAAGCEAAVMFLSGQNKLPFFTVWGPTEELKHISGKLRMLADFLENKIQIINEPGLHLVGRVAPPAPAPDTEGGSFPA